MRGSEMQWSFSNKASAIHPQYLSFNTGQDNNPGKVVHNNPSASSGFASISTSEAFDSTHKPFSSLVVHQKNTSPDRQRTNNFARKSYSVQQFDGFSVHRQQQMRLLPVSNKQNHVINVFQSPFASTGQSLIGNNALSSQSVGGGIPITNPVSVQQVPSSFVGTTDLRNGSKTCGSPAQLTIFYAGSVCVYDDISPDKAQAIMLLARNGSPSTHNKVPSTVQVQAPITRPSAGRAKSPCAGLASPGSATSSSTNELATVKPAGVLASASNQTETRIAVTSVKPGSATIIPAELRLPTAAAVPQARKASLARFLEKRKERVMNASPYIVSKKSPECDAIVGSEYSFSSSSHQLPAINLQPACH